MTTVVRRPAAAVSFFCQWLRGAAAAAGTGAPVERDEMLRTFNCGVGMVVIVPAEHEAAVTALFRENGEEDVIRLGALKVWVRRKEGRKVEGRKEGSKEGRKVGRKEGVARQR